MKVVITCGGTGGHIYPALSLADALKERENAEILFIGTPNHMEARIIPANHYDFASIEAKGFNGGLLAKVSAYLLMLRQTGSAKKILREFAPDIVVGFGGYVSAPVIKAAHALHIPSVLHEQNAFAGKANLYLERYASAVVAVYENVTKQFRKKVHLLGNPRTYTALKPHKEVDITSFGCTKDMPLVLFVMGSQGSESVNAIMKNVLKQLKGRNYQVLYVTGEGHKDEFDPSEYPENVHFAAYIDQVALLPQVDLIVTRGGATTAAEISVYGVPAIIIPSPYVPNNHQEVNAQALVDHHAAVLKREKELDADDFIRTLDELMTSRETRQKMSAAAKSVSYPNSAQDIIALMKEIVHE